METRLELLTEITFSTGAHTGSDNPREVCPREFIAWVLTGTKKDEIPSCMSPTLNILPTLNDSAAWRDDAHRTEVFKNWIPKLLLCPADPERDQRRAYALADYAIRVIAVEALVLAKLPTEAAKLRQLEPIADRKTAAAAAASAAAAAASAAAASAASAAAAAVYAAADAAAYAAAAASAASAAAAVYAAADAAAYAAAARADAAAYAAAYAAADAAYAAADAAAAAAAARADAAAYAADAAAAAYAEVIERYTNALLSIIVETK